MPNARDTSNTAVPMAVSNPLVPIQLRGELHETIWGGQNLSTYAGKVIPEGMQIGESWETAIESVAVNPPYERKTLGQLVEMMGEHLLGWRAVELFGHRFPLLTKFLDARQWLSVQVHPDDSYADAHEGGKLGKTETWYILHAEPGAQLVLGLTHECSREEVRQAIAGAHLENLLHTFPVKAGDVVFVPAGTVHAIGPGVVLYELQEYSDLTYRLYDYGRLQANGQPRPLHIEQSLAVMHCRPAESTTVTPISLAENALDGERRILVASTYFLEEELRIRGSYPLETLSSSCHILTLLGGECEISYGIGRLSLSTGDTVVVPAALGPYRLESRAGVRVLLSYVPTADDPLVTLWRRGQPGFVE
jgi:mannose-6-phosphate isomerase